MPVEGAVRRQRRPRHQASARHSGRLHAPLSSHPAMAAPPGPPGPADCKPVRLRSLPCRTGAGPAAAARAAGSAGLARSLRGQQRPVRCGRGLHGPHLRRRRPCHAPGADRLQPARRRARLQHAARPAHIQAQSPAHARPPARARRRLEPHRDPGRRPAAVAQGRRGGGHPGHPLQRPPPLPQRHLPQPAPGPGLARRAGGAGRARRQCGKALPRGAAGRCVADPGARGRRPVPAPGRRRRTAGRHGPWRRGLYRPRGLPGGGRAPRGRARAVRPQPPGRRLRLRAGGLRPGAAAGDRPPAPEHLCGRERH